LLGDQAGVLDLDVGGYGSDDSRRPRLVGAAQRKAAQKYGAAFGPASTVLVGDTELDVAAALQGGALVIAVATGVRSQEELRQAGAHAVLPDLADTARFMAVLGALTGPRQEAP
jgi:phosphoglycolate phosphatase-like HAD superfamily hydrolase